VPGQTVRKSWALAGQSVALQAWAFVEWRIGMSGLQILSYVSIAFFLVVVAAKMIRIARMPVHLRWDLYPIPHEKGRSYYGGSYFEEVNWWTKPMHFSLVSEVREMA
jgi:hypothetical protein